MKLAISLIVFLFTLNTYAQISAEEYVKMTKEKMLIYDYKTALKNLDKVVSLDPSLASAYRERGIVKFNTKKFIEAIKDFDKAIELEDPSAFPFTKKGMPYFHRGSSNFKLGKYNQAIKDFDIVINIESSSWRRFAYKYCGTRYLKLGKKEIACQYWSEGDISFLIEKHCK
mgnify:CR=1 FL=1